MGFTVLNTSYLLCTCDHSAIIRGVAPFHQQNLVELLLRLGLYPYLGYRMGLLLWRTGRQTAAIRTKPLFDKLGLTAWHNIILITRVRIPSSVGIVYTVR